MNVLAAVNQVEQQPWFRAAHRWLVPRAKYVKWLLQLYAALILVPVVADIYIRWAQPVGSPVLFFHEIAEKAGTLSALFYVATLIPGILRRFQILPLTRSILMLWRRWLGVAMFHSALVHGLLISILPTLFFRPQLLLQPSQHALYGTLAVALLFPLWLTSNDWSVRTMRQGWHWIHKLTYIALFFVYLHVAGTGELTLRIVVGGAMALEVFSWIVRLFSRQPAVKPVQ